MEGVFVEGSFRWEWGKPKRCTVCEEILYGPRTYHVECFEDNGSWCNAPNKGWICTRPVGHPGNHIACYSAGRRCGGGDDEWPQRT